jgi:UBX domain-containing protein 1
MKTTKNLLKCCSPSVAPGNAWARNALHSTLHTLTPLFSTSSTTSSTTTTTVAVDSKIEAVSVDESKPVTSIQIRLHDGSKLQAKFNLEHTAADIRRFIMRFMNHVNHVTAAHSMHRNKPQNRAFDLMTTFPQKVITDESQTIQQLGLANSVIVQKLK